MEFKVEVVKETSAIKKKLSILHWGIGKNALRASQELARLHP
jgi:hypothetical protein